MMIYHQSNQSYHIKSYSILIFKEVTSIQNWNIFIKYDVSVVIRTRFIRGNIEHVLVIQYNIRSLHISLVCVCTIIAPKIWGHSYWIPISSSRTYTIHFYTSIQGLRFVAFGTRVLCHILHVYYTAVTMKQPRRIWLNVLHELLE